MCDCKATIQELLKKQHEEREPEATDHRAVLEGYTTSINMKTGVASLRPSMDYTLTARHTSKKTGTVKAKSVKGRMMFSFCPFCGESLRPAAAMSEGGEQA